MSTNLRLFIVIVSFLVLSLQTVAQNSEDVPVVLASSNRPSSNPISFEQMFQQTGLDVFKTLHTGAGIRIGVIDTSFGAIQSFEERSLVSVSIPGEASIEDYDLNGNTHGTDVLEIVNRIAPRAALYACRYGDNDAFLGFQRCIDYMINQGVDIVNHSAGIPALPLDGTNSWATALDPLLDNGIVWVNAAGNFARGYLRGFFSDINQDAFHEFGPNTQDIRLTNIANYQGNIALSWSASSNVQLSLEIVDLNDETARFDEGDTVYRGASFESIFINLQNTPTSNISVRIKNENTALNEPIEFALFIEYVALPASFEQGSVIAPADNPRVLTVGALHGDTIASYSSRGTLRNDSVLPDLVAPTGIILHDGRVFEGTSASAPIVTGALALLKERFSALEGQALVGFLLGNAVRDFGLSGRDTEYGEGILSLPINIVDSVVPTLQPLCSLEVYANTNKRSGPGTGYRDLGTIPANATVTVIGRHDGADGFEWFYLGEGEWVRANTGDRIGNCVDLLYYLEDGTIAPEGFTTDCPNLEPTDFAIGDRVQQTLSEDPVRVLQDPTSGTTLYYIYPSQTVTFVDGPRCSPLSDGSPGRWWQISSDRGPSGWVAEGDANRSFWRIID